MNNPRNCGCQKWLTECNQREGCYSATRMKAMSNEQDLMREGFSLFQNAKGFKRPEDPGEREAFAAGAAWQAARQQAVPSGYVMVPVEPTPEMLSAAKEVWDLVDGVPDFTAMEIEAAAYRAMLAAAPQAAPQADQAAEPVVYWVLFDSTGGPKYIKKDAYSGALAIFDNESDANRAKRINEGTDYKRVEYFKAPPAPDVSGLVEALESTSEKLKLVMETAKYIQHTIDKALAPARAALAAHRSNSHE